MKQKINSHSPVLSNDSNVTNSNVVHITESIPNSSNLWPVLSSITKHKQLVDSLKSRGFVKTSRVENWWTVSVDGKLFCGSDPYHDTEKGIGFEATISAPHIQAIILELMEKHLKTGSIVLDIGSGSGYLTICMAQVTGSKGKFIGIDDVESLIMRSKEILRFNFSHL